MKGMNEKSKGRKVHTYQIGKERKKELRNRSTVGRERKREGEGGDKCVCVCVFGKTYVHSMFNS